MRVEKRILEALGLFLCLQVISACSASAQTPQKTIQSPAGWVVKYGVVPGATTQPAAIVSELRSVAKKTGESPRISKPFRYKGTNTVGVFYQVKDHSAGNVPYVGLILSDFDDKKLVEIALMYDTQSRFPRTLKPMMETVFKEWRPGGTTAAAMAQEKTAPSTKVLPLHPITLSDGSASAIIPDGWQLGPMSHGGTITVQGPHQEFIMLNGSMLGMDPRSQTYQNDVRMHIQEPAIKLVMPYNADPGRAFPYLYQTTAHILGWNPTDLKVDQTQMISTANGRCMQGRGHVNNFGNGLMELDALFCPDTPTNPQTGIYMTYAYFSVVPDSLAEQEGPTTAAVMSSFSWNKVMVQQEANRLSAPQIAQMQNMYQDHMRALSQFTQAQIERTHEIGREATQRYMEADRTRVESSQRFDRQEENISRYGQGFSNYILDQNVVEYTNYYGQTAHETLPNNIAYGLVKDHPDRIAIVDTPNYIPEIDFRK